MNKNEKPVAHSFHNNRSAQLIAGEVQITLRHGLTSSTGLRVKLGSPLPIT